jgi:hypothetical protein
MTATTTALPADTWTAQLAKLKERYKHVRPPIVAALNILLHDANISIDDAKTQAQLHGVRITAASVNAAKTLLARMDNTPEPAAKPATGATATARAPRRVRTADAPADAETLIRGVVTKLQTQGNAEAERLRETVRKAIAMLQAAVGAE